MFTSSSTGSTGSGICGGGGGTGGLIDWMKFQPTNMQTELNVCKERNEWSIN